MFIYCSNCNYDSGDLDGSERVKRQIKEDGGDWEKDICPDCEDDGELRLD